jgi:hypothetical protein
MMRALAILLSLIAIEPAVVLAASPIDLQGLEQAWHRCIREAYTHQPPGQSRAGNERNALDECRDHEDAYVAALMAERPRSTWAQAWATITEPMRGWVGKFWR